MTFEERISAFAELGQFFLFLSQNKTPKNNSLTAKFNYWKEDADNLIQSAEFANNWFTKENIYFALENWGNALTVDRLKTWLENYPKNLTSKNVGIIMAGNLPLVGFHDLLAVVITGNNALIKPSSKDEKLLFLVKKYLETIHDDFINSIKFVEKLENFDAVIATGSNNTSRYFEQYFSTVPNIIRKNRTSIAILDGNETEKDLENLGEDLFRYFGLGCRNVTKLYLKDENQLQPIIQAIFKWGETLVNHTKYANNYDYNRAIYLLSKDLFFDNNFILIKKDNSLHSPIAVIHYEIYDNLEIVLDDLKTKKDEIQCLVTNLEIDEKINFGETQKPKLTDYADGIDTLQFLKEL